MGVWLGPRSRRGIKEGEFSYTGNYLFTSEGHNWEIALTTSGVLRFNKNPGKVDICMVGGGQTAPRYEGERNASSNAVGDPGGNGGEIVNRQLSFFGMIDYTIEIGKSDENTTFSGNNISIIAHTGQGGQGGAGASANSAGAIIANSGAPGVFAYGQEIDTLLIENFKGHRFGAGAGGGAARYLSGPWGQGAEGGDTGVGHDSQEHGHGGITFGWNSQFPDGKPGRENHGQGGGGAAYYWVSTGAGASRVGEQGSGGSGIVFIRNHRS